MPPARLAISTLLVAVVDHLHVAGLVEIAHSLIPPGRGQIFVLDVVEASSEADGSADALPARRARTRLKELTKALPTQVHPIVRISRTLSEGVVAAAREVGADMVMAGWSPALSRRPDTRSRVEEVIRAVARSGSSHAAMIQLGASPRPDRILVAVRGGPHAELALTVAAQALEYSSVPVAVLHVTVPGLPWAARHAYDAALQEIVERHVPGDVDRIVRESPDVAATILAEGGEKDLLLLGAAVTAEEMAPGYGLFGPVPERLLREARSSVMIMRTRETIADSTFDELASKPGTLAAVDRAAEELRAIPARVDHWFAESNFHHSEFADLAHLVVEKERQALTVSLVLPTLDEAATIGPIVRRARESLMERHALVDELLVIDSMSTDRTREIAEAEGAHVVEHRDVLPRLGSHRGKGEALWKSLFETTGDIVAWADTDVHDWHPRMVYGTVGPLIMEPRIQYIKGYYQRPIVEGGVLKEGGGGRVTELVARPLINLLYPELSGFIQPLAGEYAGRRSLLEAIPFFTGYAVEIGHLIDIYERGGLAGLGQVDLERRVHRNQELEGLSKMAFVIIQAVLTRLGDSRKTPLLAELGSRMKLPRSGPEELLLEVIELGDLERPPMSHVPEYAERTPARARIGATT